MQLKWMVPALLCMALGGCVTQDVQLDKRHVATASKQAIVGRMSCRLPAFELVDARSYKGLGWVNGHELLYPELDLWVKDALHNVAETDAAATPLIVELSRAYIETHPSGHSFQLVMRVRGSNQTAPEWRVYRGIESGVTWWGNGGEFGNYIEDAGKAAIRALVKQEGRCR